jgi:hypothetical protein
MAVHLACLREHHLLCAFDRSACDGIKKIPRHIRAINNGSDAIGCVGYRPVVDPPFNIRVHTATLCGNNDLPGGFTDMTATANKLDNIDLSDKLSLGANAPTTFMQVTIDVDRFALACLPKVFHSSNRKPRRLPSQCLLAILLQLPAI